MASLSLIFEILARDRASGVLDRIGERSTVLGRVAAVGIGAGAAALAAFAVSSAKAGADFDATIRQIGSVAGIPKEQLKELSDIALQFGASTKFSAGEASEAMLELAKGGLSAAQIKGGALASTLTLAAAGGVDLASAATTVSTGLNTFGLKADKAGQVSAALAGAANASAASVESLALGLAQVGPGAKNAGLSIQETAAALAAFANAGIQGSDAGTSLKTFLARLVPTTKEAAAAMRRLGLDFTDASGNFLPLAQVSEQLKDKLGALSPEARSVALATIFGSDATRAATVLFKEGAAGIEKYTAATSDQGAAQRIATSNMEGTKGAVEKLKGSFETLQIKAGLALGPIIEKAALMAAAFLDDVAPSVAAFTDKLRILQPVADLIVKVLGSILGFVKDNSVAFGSLSVAIGTYTLVMNASAIATGLATIALRAYLATAAFAILSFSSLRGAVLAFNLALAANPIGVVIALLAGLAAGLVFAYKNSETFRDIVRGAFSTVLGAVDKALGGVELFFKALRNVPGFGWADAAAQKIAVARGGVDALRASLDAIPARKKVEIDLVVNGINTIAGTAAKLDRLGDGPGAGPQRAVGGSTLNRVRGVAGAFGASISSTYRTPARNRAVGGSPTSFHLDKANPAVDIVGSTGQLDAVFKRLSQEGPWRELLWRVPGHRDHVHVAHRGDVVGAGWPRMPGDGPTERTARLQVGETVGTAGDTALLLEAVLRLERTVAAMPQVFQGNRRAAFV